MFWTAYSRVPHQERARALQLEARRGFLPWENGTIWVDGQARSDLGRGRGRHGDGEGHHQDWHTLPRWPLWHKWNRERNNWLLGGSLYEMREPGRGIRLEKTSSISCAWTQNAKYNRRPSPTVIAMHILSHLTSEITYNSSLLHQSLYIGFSSQPPKSPLKMMPN